MKPRLAKQQSRALTVGQNLATATVALFLLGLPSVVQAQFTFTTNNGSLTITGYAGPGGVVVIPSTTNGYAVTGIGEYAFAACTNLTIVTIPSSITNIGLAPFLDCAGLTNISVASGNSSYSSINGVLFDKTQDTLVAYPAGRTTTNGTYFVPGGVISISQEAFFGCDLLTNIVITNTVASIGDLAFYGCSSLKSAGILGSYYYNSTNATSIGVESFAFCTSLTNFTTFNAITNIGVLAFAYCTNLTSAFFATNPPPPDNGNAFYGDPDAVVYYQLGTTGWGATFGGVPTALEPTPVSDFDYQTYNGSVTITEYNNNGPAMVVIPGYINGYPVTSIGGGGLNGVFPSDVTIVIIPNTVTNIGDSAFEYCFSLTSVTIPNSVTNIGMQAFAECESLTNIVFSNSVTSIGGWAFEGCVSLTSVTIPSSVTSIGEGSVFADCTSLTNISVNTANLSYSSLNGVLFDKAQDALIVYPVGLTNSTYTIPNSVTSIGEEAFIGCGNLASVTIPGSVTNIGAAAFYFCTSLTNIVFPNSITSIGADAFWNCGLTSITIPNSVTSIGQQAFYVCKSLTNVIILNSAISIGGFAFGYCSSLTSAYFQGNAPPDNGTVFYGDPATVYYLPGTTGWGATFGGVPTALWYQPQPTVLSFEPSFGVRNQQFGFPVSWATNASVIVQACTNLANPTWIPLATNALSNGTNYFSDAQWTNYPCRFYRVSGPQ